MSNNASSLILTLNAVINYLKQKRFPLQIIGGLTNQLPSMPKASFGAQFSNQCNSPHQWFCWVILISHCGYHGNPTAVHLDDLIIISAKLVAEQGIFFYQERSHKLGNGQVLFFFFLTIIHSLGNEHI